MKTDNQYLRALKNGCLPVKPLEVTEVFTLFLRQCRTPFYFSGELHSPWELVYIRKGAACITADDNVYRLPQGSVIFHKPLEFHQIQAEEAGLEIFVVSFTMRAEQPEHFYNAVFHPDQKVRELFERLIAETVALNGGPFTESTEKNCYPLWQANKLAFSRNVQLLEYILTHFLDHRPASFPPQSTGESALYRKAVGYLERNVCRDISIADIAEYCCVSQSSLKATFRRHAGCGIHKYFLKLKLRTAIGFLEAGKSVTEVSNLLGFNNPNYFSFVFRRETGKSPSDHKK